MSSDDAATLHAEMAALQAVMMSLLRKLAHEHPELTPSFCAAFDEAEDVLMGLAMKIGLEEATGTTMSALRVVEDLRRGTLHGHAACASA